MPEESLKTIGEVAKELGLTLRALRFYEDKKLVKPQRQGTTRLYSKADVHRLKLILPWHRAGLTLQQARQALGHYDRGEIREMERAVHTALNKELDRRVTQVRAIRAILFEWVN